MDIQEESDQVKQIVEESDLVRVTASIKFEPTDYIASIVTRFIPEFMQPIKLVPEDSVK